jgi:hypothetical protein
MLLSKTRKKQPNPRPAKLKKAPPIAPANVDITTYFLLFSVAPKNIPVEPPITMQARGAITKGSHPAIIKIKETMAPTRYPQPHPAAPAKAN